MNSQYALNLGWRPFFIGFFIALQGVTLASAHPTLPPRNDELPLTSSLAEEFHPNALNHEARNLGPTYVIAQYQQETTLFDNNNIYGVRNSPSNPTQFYLSNATRLTYFMNYHWNRGRGQTPGTMWLTHQDGTTYGPWQATTQSGQGGVPNAYWIVRPNVTLKAGNYTLGDSHPSSWANNQQSEFRGMSVLKGVAINPTAGQQNGSGNSPVDCSHLQGIERILCEHDPHGDHSR
ncbi:hypothetical protein [Synechococcus sp. BDU 130192]|uniref:hypothetical protein n=1 Tax=Synechococcus sp. BDU 130192 TaxID=2042059 RepID=UPI000C081372|nr:hypothetical protein [Synechococcus sp. BDU 130192]